ncbi:MAG TPA: hypothetical protein PLS53_07670 [Thermoanaerobaculaceae bacterium]|nr:hypothetical protein [Thermoanaerobaculaceae bacterium]HPS78015.1 hypothetical protein [Thermoanaerobaculaceae bacterium]
MRRSLAPSAVLALAAVVLTVACGSLFPTKIGDLKANPGKYEGKVVTISGTVTASANVLFVKGFWVEDGSGKILVVPKAGVPQEGEKVTVKGKVEQILAIGSASTVVFHQE